MRIVRTIADARTAVADARSAGRSMRLVPTTMGALHEGQLSLMNLALRRCL